MLLEKLSVNGEQSAVQVRAFVVRIRCGGVETSNCLLAGVQNESRSLSLSVKRNDIEENTVTTITPAMDV